jgi:ribosomal protein L24
MDSPPLWPQEKQRHVKIVAGKNKGKTGVFQTMKTKNTCVVKLDINGTYVCVRLTSIEDVAF